MRIAESTLAVAGLLEHLPSLISGIYKDAYKRFLAVLRYATGTNIDARCRLCLSLNLKKLFSRSSRCDSPQENSCERSLSSDLVRRIFREMNIGNHVRPQSIMHPVCTVSRTSLYNMVLFVLSVIVAAIVAIVAIPRIRHHIPFGGFTRFGIARGDFSIARDRSEKSRIAGPMKQFLVVVLPDGKIITPRVADQL
jgi:hypothetical protein